MATATGAEGGERRFGLDLARALAIALVLASHAVFMLPLGGARARTLVHELAGRFGVDLFFVLSGLLIGGILLRALDPTDPAPGPLAGRLRRFWLRRWLRTLPNYYLFLALAWSVWAWTRGPSAPDPRYLVFLQNVSRRVPGVMPESWSLTIEEWSYVTLPLVLGAALLLPLARPRALLAGLLAFIGVFMGVRLAAAGAGTIEADLRLSLITRLDAVAWGVLVAWGLRYHAAAAARAAAPCLALGVALVAAAAEWCSRLDAGLPVTRTQTLVFPLTSVGFALCMPWLSALRAPRAWVRRPIEHLSLTSYSAYLSHFSVVLPLVVRWVPPERWGLRLLAFFAGTLALSTLAYRLFERPIMDLRERFPASRVGSR